jgi:hypothetical protein
LAQVGLAFRSHQCCHLPTSGSSGSVRQSSPPASVFYFQTQASKIFHFEFEGDVRIYEKNILYFLYILYLADIEIFSIYELIVVKYWDCNQIMGI